MPTYEYECSACGHAFEELQSMTDARLKKCPQCGKSKLARLIGSGAGMIFKGTGFYETDYKKKTPSGSENKNGKPETKPAASTANKPAASCGGSCACHPG